MYCNNVTISNTVIVGSGSREMYTRTSLDLSTNDYVDARSRLNEKLWVVPHVMNASAASRTVITV